MNIKEAWEIADDCEHPNHINAVMFLQSAIGRMIWFLHQKDPNETVSYHEVARAFLRTKKANCFLQHCRKIFHPSIYQKTKNTNFNDKRS